MGDLVFQGFRGTWLSKIQQNITKFLLIINFTAEVHPDGETEIHFKKNAVI